MSNKSTKSDEAQESKIAEEALAEAEAEVEDSVDAEDNGAPDEPTTLEEQLLTAQEEAKEYLDGWQRARAELANFRKRVDRDRSQMRSRLQGEAVKNLLPVLDDFDLAMENMPEDLAEHDWVSGIALIHRKLQTKLEEMGVEEIEALGEEFDPEYHEAVMQREEEDAEPGTVVEVLRKGYRIDDWVLRASMVVVAN